MENLWQELFDSDEVLLVGIDAEEIANTAKSLAQMARSQKLYVPGVPLAFREYMVGGFALFFGRFTYHDEIIETHRKFVIFKHIWSHGVTSA